MELLRIMANALLAKKTEMPLRVYLLLPAENKINNFRDVLRLVKRNMLAVTQEGKKISFTPKPLYEDSFLDYFKNIEGDVEIAVHNNNKDSLISCLRRIRADIALPVIGPFGNDMKIPWLGYIYDFQHKYYPEFFTSAQCRQRDELFSAILNEAKAVIVNARTVEEDIYKYFPDAPARIFSLPFASSPVRTWFEQSSTDIEKKYVLPERYFMISNQLWIHKAHMTAFEALSKLTASYGETVHIVCTGKTEDHRFPEYFKEVKAGITELGLDGRIHFLGHIPKIEQIHIMQKAIAVLQPSLFEGGPGGGSVYDAVAIGTPAIVSDIPVNLEIKEDNVVFFKAGSSDDMASKMMVMIRKKRRQSQREELISRGIVRTKMLGDRLIEAVRYVTN